MGIVEAAPGLRDLTNLDMKRELRREFVFYLYLSGRYTQERIAEIAGVSRDTVYHDLKWANENLVPEGMNLETIRSQAVIQIHLDRVKALTISEEALTMIRDKDDISAADAKRLFDVSAKFIGIAAELDIKLLERFTQQATNAEAEGKALEANQTAKWVMDFMVEKLGPEALNGFEDYMRDRLLAEKLRG